LQRMVELQAMWINRKRYQSKSKLKHQYPWASRNIKTYEK